MINASVEDVATAIGLGVAVGRFRAELVAAGPALGRLREARHPSGGMLDSDCSGVLEPLDYIDESIGAMVRGVELAPTV